jgi:hypothetical protein
MVAFGPSERCLRKVFKRHKTHLYETIKIPMTTVNLETQKKKKMLR